MYKSENRGAWTYVISMFLLKNHLVISTSQFPREKCPQLPDEVAFILTQVLVLLSIRGLFLAKTFSSIEQLSGNQDRQPNFSQKL